MPLPVLARRIHDRLLNVLNVLGLLVELEPGRRMPLAGIAEQQGPPAVGEC